MIKIIFSSLLILGSTVLFAQQASDYFPQTPGYRWDYKVIPLDSANNEIDSMTYYRVDSFAVATNFMGRSGDLVLSKTGTHNLINFIPFTDSSYFSFENTEGYYYFRISNLGNLVAILDSAGLDSTLLGVVQSFENWYSVYRFSQPVNAQYTIFSKDTTLNIGGTDLPLRFEYFGKRLADETIQTDAGTFTCKKFLLSMVVSYIVFPPITIELLRLETTKWISANIWLVQELSPSQTVDFSLLGYGSFNIPGTKTELIPLITDIKHSGMINPGFALAQNYPNPFNPETNIQFTLPGAGKVTLKIYDVLGREVLTLLNGERNSGSYSVTFNPEMNRLASGFYIYELNFKGMHLSRKMIYLK